MNNRTLARQRLDGSGWAHPYGHGPFSPVVYADGGDGAESGSSSAGGDSSLEAVVAASTGQEGQQAAQPAGQQAGKSRQPTDPWADFQWDGKVDSLPPDVAKLIRDARDEAGKARTVAKQNAATEAREELLASISKAVGLDGGDKPPTPEELTQQLMQSQSELSTAQEQAASAAIELNVYRAAHRLGADADALLDSRSFCDVIDSIDVSDDPKAFSAAVEKAINEALGKNPGLRAATSAGRSGGDLSGGSGEGGAKSRPTSLSAAVRGAFGT